MFANAGQKLTAFFTYFFDRYKPAIITLLLLAGAYYFYFNVIVSQNEAALKDRNFRGLHRIASNVSAKLTAYAEQNADNFLQARKVLSQTEGQPAEAQLSQDYGLMISEGPASDSESRLQVGFKNGWKFYFTNPAGETATASVREFIAPFLRRDLFTHYVLTHDDTVLFDELNISNRHRSDFLKEKEGPDTTQTGALQAGEMSAVHIGGREYRLFVLSFVAEGNQQFSIGGYMPASRYESEQRYIPTYALIWMVIGLLLVLLMFPLLKIFLMQPSEQLMARNAVASLAALHITGAVVVLVALNIYVYFTFVTPAADKTLKDLATQTARVFVTELDSALKEMKAIETAIDQDPTLLRDRLLQVKPSPDSAMEVARSVGSYLPGKSYPYFYNLSWAANTGLQAVRWTTLNYLPRKINISERDYYSAVRSGNLLRRGDDSFYVSAVSSWVSKGKLVVVAKPYSRPPPPGTGTASLAVMSMSAPFRSLFNALMPQGYGFCLVQANGDVLFHLDPARSLNENLVEETRDDGALQALLSTRSSGFAGARYSGGSHRFYLEPVPGTPFTLVTFRDMRIVWSEDLDVITTCSILCLMNLAVILLAILIIQAAGYRNSLLENQSILFTWLRPSKSLIPAYRSVTTFFLLSVILQVAFFFSFNDEDELSLIGTAFAYSYLLISYMYLRFGIIDNPNDRERFINKKPIAALIAVYLFCCGLFTVTLRSGRDHFILAQLLLLLLGALFHFLPVWRRRLLVHKNFRWWYVSSLFAFVAATGITPILVFYCLSFKEERLLSLKHNQLRFAEALLQQPADTLTPPTNQLTLSFAKPFHFSGFAETVSGAEPPALTSSDSTNGFEKLYRDIKPAFSPHSREIENLIRSVHNRGDDFFWQHKTTDNNLHFYYAINKAQALFASPGLGISSRIRINLRDTGLQMAQAWDKTLLLVAALLLLLKGFEALLKRLIRRIFFEGFEETTQQTETDLPLVDTLPAAENMFIIGPVNSGKHSSIVGRLRQKDILIIEEDLAELTTKEVPEVAAAIKLLADEYRKGEKRYVVLLRHFEFCMNDFSVTKKKLLLLETLLLQKQQLIVLSSRSVEAVPITDAAGTAVDSASFTDRWSNALNQFYNLYHHWRRPEAEPADTARVQALREGLFAEGRKKIRETVPVVLLTANHEVVMKSLDAFLLVQIDEFLDKVDSECSHSDFLWSLRPSLFNFIETHKHTMLAFDFQDLSRVHMRQVISQHFIAQFEQVVLKIQSLAANYYLAIWRSLARDEQRTLFDIGTDDMVNPANRRLAARLANLGLVTPEPSIACYQLMNRSFRNFIFTQLDQKEMQTLQAGAGEKRSWSSFQLPVLTVVVGLAAFLFTTQKDAFTNLVAYLGAAAGGIAALLKVLGMIPSNKA